MKVEPMTYDYDYFVIGAGSGGVRSARIASALGARVGLAEGWHFGGTCVNVGCIPKKIYSYAGGYGDAIAEARNYGWDIQAKFNWKKLKQAKDKEIERLNGIYRNILNINKVDIHEGYASFHDAHTIEIKGQKVTAERILIACGGHPTLPDIEGKEFLKTSDDMFALDEIPTRVVILGAGYIGLEFAHILHSIGCDVTVIHRGDHLLRGFDIDVQDHLLQQMQSQGIEILFNKSVTRAEKDAIFIGDEKIEAELILAATGRKANTGRLNLEKAGIVPNAKGFIDVNDRYETCVPNIFAIGDVTPTWALTPVAIAQGHILADTLFNKNNIRDCSFDHIPTAVFSKPEIGTIGMTEQAAYNSGHDYKIFKTTFRPLRHTITGMDEKILMKMIVDKDSDKILGLHICGTDAAEMIQSLAFAFTTGATKRDFDRTLPVHPTSAEELALLHVVGLPHPPEVLAKRG